MVGFPENISGFHCADVGKKFNLCALSDVVQTLRLPLIFSLSVFFWKYFTTGYILTEKDSMRFYQKLIQNR
ncbi:MAG: hypothetical protein O0X49_01975, partial [Methanocorpusculum sp.]|nr:hypothetical protein [Methanocorpusculum sp.]